MTNYSDWTQDELVELWAERAAIRQYDGGLDQRTAERAAYFDWRVLVGRGIAAPEYIIERARTFAQTDLQTNETPNH